MLQLNKFIPSHLDFSSKETKQVPHFTYIVEIPYKGSLLYKVGIITNVQSRIMSFAAVNKPSSAVFGQGIILGKPKLLGIVNFPCRRHALIYEYYIKDTYSAYKYLGMPILANGNTELFTINILELLISQ